MEPKVRYVKIILFLVFISVLVSGCLIGDGEHDYAMSHITPTPAQSSLTTPTTIPIPSTTIPPSIYWIRIEPIGDKQVGEIFTINSSTNLSAGEEILVQVYKSHWHTSIKSFIGEFSGGMGIVNVSPGRNGTNTISFIVNSSAFNLVPDEYLITENAIHKDSTGEIRFNITPGKTS